MSGGGDQSGTDEGQGDFVRQFHFVFVSVGTVHFVLITTLKVVVWSK
jgi:hypothetical protein